VLCARAFLCIFVCDEYVRSVDIYIVYRGMKEKIHIKEEGERKTKIYKRIERKRGKVKRK
jgi:hypothetical protein